MLFRAISRIFFTLFFLAFFAHFFEKMEIQNLLNHPENPELQLFMLAVTAPAAIGLFFGSAGSNMRLPGGRVIQINRWNLAFLISVCSLIALLVA